MPVYNAENTVSRMVDSILAQTMTEWELIAVDDGSTDASSKILDAYAERDIRIKVFHKPNEGVAIARQFGLDNIIGEYSIHADSDDWMGATMLEEMYSAAINNNSDIVVTDYYENSELGVQTIKKQNVQSLIPIEFLYGILTSKYFGSLWNKLIRTSLYKKSNVYFYKGVNYMEDVVCLVRLLQNQRIIISYLNKPFYHYQINSNSISHLITKDTYHDIIRMHRKICELLPDIDERFVSYKKLLPLGVFHAGFMNYIYSDEEVNMEFQKVKGLAYKTKSPKWLLGYFLIQIGCYRIAHKIIRY